MAKAEVFMRRVLTCEQWVDKINTRLRDYGQQVRVESYTRNTIILSDGSVLKDRDYRIFKRRVLNRHEVWIKNMDSLLAGTTTEKDIKSYQAAIGGQNCQKRHSEKLKQNLNTGIPWNKGTKGTQMGWSKGLTKTTDPRVARMAELKCGEGNGMFGVIMSDEDKQKKSKRMKDLILVGQFTPNSNNRNTHWDAEFNGKKYRSSWEALYQAINPVAEYETLRIEYEIDTSHKIYIVDFIDRVNKKVAEVKPKELCSGPVFEAKMEALHNWATANDYEVIVADKEWFQAQPCPCDYSMFDEKTTKKVKALYETCKKNRD